MTFRARLQLFGMPLIVVPLAATVFLYSILVGRAVEDSKRDLISAKLSLLENRISVSYDVLFKVGLQDKEFFIQNARDSITRSFAGFLSPGEHFMIFSGSGEYLGGSIDPPSQSLDSHDPLAVALAGPAGIGSLASSFLPGKGERYLVGHDRFKQWDWHLAFAADEATTFGALRSAAAIALGVSALFVILSAFGLFFIATKISEPLARLTSLAKRLGESRLEHIPDIDDIALLGPEDEIAVLAREFQSMSISLASLTRGLETRVDERTAELRSANERLGNLNLELQEALERGVHMKDQLVQSEKLAALGQLVAGIAHELNTPLGAIGSAAATLDHSVDRTLMDLPAMLRSHGVAELEAAFGLLGGNTTLYANQDRKSRMGRREALASLLRERGLADPDESADMLADCGVTDPATIPQSIAGSSGDRLVAAIYELSVLKRSAAIIAKASGQAVRVIDALRIYARKSEGDSVGPVALEESIDSVLTLFHSKARNDVEIIRQLAAGLVVLADPQKLAQIWINLVNNALQAMDYSGRLLISARLADQGMIQVDFNDTGPGIPDGVLSKIFTPFFTTKKPGEGSGLGLEISRTIAEGFGGSMGFESRPGSTTFWVRIPAAKS